MKFKSVPIARVPEYVHFACPENFRILSGIELPRTKYALISLKLGTLLIFNNSWVVVVRYLSVVPNSRVSTSL